MIMERRLVALIFTAFSFLLVSRSGSAQLPPPISIANPTSFRPNSPAELKTIEDAMAAVMTVTVNDLGLPLVEPLYIHLHPTTSSFAANAGAAGRRLPSNTARFAIAVATENRFHIDMEKTRGRAWSALIGILAHEYAHNVEYTFSSLHRGSQWLREGFADWVAAKVLHHLGWQNYPTSVHRARQEVRRQKTSIPTLADLEDSQGWSVWASYPNGSILTYRLAFLAVDKLLTHAGVAEMQRYFVGQDFQRAFGMPWNQFAREFTASLTTLAPAPRPANRAEKPVWKPGDQWHYAWKIPGRTGTFIRELVREEVFESHAVYTFQIGANEYLHTKESLALVATRSKGKWVSKRSSPHEFFSWPLEAGKAWQTSFLRENSAQNSSQKLSFHKVVADIEQVRSPAGDFEAFKIETYGAENGRLITEEWYAPGAKWFVKTRTYLDVGVREEELISFKLG